MTAEPWTHARHCDAAEAETAAFAAGLEGADPDLPVPSCPGWSVADLATHLGGTQRWAEGIVRTGAQERRSRRDLGVTFPAEPGEILSWYVDGGERLIKTLRAADGDRPVWGWGPDPHVRFWSRRMLYETLVHRCDLDIALGREPVIDARIAVDGIDELLANLRSAAGFAPKVDHLRGDGTALAFVAADAGIRWTFRMWPDRFEWTPEPFEDAGKADAAVRGDAADVYLFLWGRRKLGDPRLDFSGDDALLIHWVENSAI
ncbi:maleylpyruvate isomerase family mycothiol-dependent enzyme [Actinomadura sp. 9N407]|uniref:maleylpyruvate isomerase family mycothiol-dependent enzyme n=1 Tax=Actinomadura sp. 9N407 TaxID=3375154 RepID=UPI0037951D5A